MMLDDDPQVQERARNEQIKELLFGKPCMYADLPVDACFYGLGFDREPIMIGVEVKKADDMANSIVATGRLLEQFRKAFEYGCKKCYLCLQGEIRGNKRTGLVEVRKWNDHNKKYEWCEVSPPVMWNRWAAGINTLEVQAGIIVKRTNDMYETASTIVALYNWWQTAVDEHQSLERFYTPTALTGKIPLFRRVVKEFDGVGWTRSLDFMKVYAGTGLSLLDVLNMDPKVWATGIKGIGKTTAEKMAKQLRDPVEL